LTFFEPLPDDRYTLTVSDSITDQAGNALDGESNADEPQEDPLFPSGDGVHGGDFVARFTVDTRPEIGVYHSGSVWVDTNGNYIFDPQNPDYTNRDITYVLGYATDNLIAGNFSNPGAGQIADGFDKLGAYGRVGYSFRWLIDTDNDGVANPPLGIVDPKGLNGIPVAGNFDGNAMNGDEVGLLVGTTWWFDTDHDYKVDSSLRTPDLTGFPMVGDFDGNGVEDLGVWKDDKFTIMFNPPAPNGQSVWGGVDYHFGFIGTREKPVAADMDRDGIDDMGLWTPDRSGVNPDEEAEWYILVSGGTPFNQRIAQEGGIAEFRPEELFGNDIYALFGNEFATPVLGNFDPPVAPPTDPPVSIGNTNVDNRFDVNADGFVTALDVLIVTDDINSNGSRELQVGTLDAPFLDVSEDGSVTPLDILEVVDHLNSNAGTGVTGGEGEAAPAALATIDTPAAQDVVEAGDLQAAVAYVGLSADASLQSVVEVQQPQPATNVVDEEEDEEEEVVVNRLGKADAGARSVFDELGDASDVRRSALDEVLAEIADDVDGATETDALDSFFSRLR
jgi:hypothetical protein